MLSTNDVQSIEDRLENDSPDYRSAVLIWLFAGSLGMHRLYLRKPRSGLALLTFGVLGWYFLWADIGRWQLFLLSGWLLIDLLILPGMVQHNRNRLRQSMWEQALAGKTISEPAPVPEVPDDFVANAELAQIG